MLKISDYNYYCCFQYCCQGRIPASLECGLRYSAEWLLVKSSKICDRIKSSLNKLWERNIGSGVWVVRLVFSLLIFLLQPASTTYLVRFSNLGWLEGPKQILWSQPRLVPCKSFLQNCRRTLLSGRIYQQWHWEKTSLPGESPNQTAPSYSFLL